MILFDEMTNLINFLAGRTLFLHLCDPRHIFGAQRYEMFVISFHQFMFENSKKKQLLFWSSAINVCTPEVYQSVKSRAAVQWSRVLSLLGYGHPMLASATTAFIQLKYFASPHCM